MVGLHHHHQNEQRKRSLPKSRFRTRLVHACYLFDWILLAGRCRCFVLERNNVSLSYAIASYYQYNPNVAYLLLDWLQIFDRVWASNVRYWKDKAMFDPEYFAFLREVRARLCYPTNSPISLSAARLWKWLCLTHHRRLLLLQLQQPCQQQLLQVFSCLSNLSQNILALVFSSQINVIFVLLADLSTPATAVPVAQAVAISPIASTASAEMITTITQMATRFVLDIYARFEFSFCQFSTGRLDDFHRAKAKDDIPRWFALLHNLYSASPQCCAWLIVCLDMHIYLDVSRNFVLHKQDLLSRDNGYAYDYLLVCPDNHVRRALAGISHSNSTFNFDFARNFLEFKQLNIS